MIQILEARSENGHYCPESHPFAYLDGSYCCKTNKEKVAEKDGTRCDGSVISWESSCCRNNRWRKCFNNPCRNYNGETEYLKIRVAA